MKSVGHGVREIKIAEGGQFRVLYLTRRGEDIVILHAFEKKTQRTARSDIDLAKQRLRSSK
jgi:phage-related protein